MLARLLNHLVRTGNLVFIDGRGHRHLGDNTGAPHLRPLAQPAPRLVDCP